MSAFWARPGIKCVCVDASNWDTTDERSLDWAVLPVEGEAYVIRGVVNLGGVIGLRLVGINNPLIPCVYGEIAFNVSRFRPLITRTQEDDVRLIKSLLLDDAGLVPAGVELDA